MKGLSYIFILLMLVGAVSCSRQDVGTDSEPGGEIRFSAGLELSLLTRTETAADFADFAVFGWNTGETAWSSATALGTTVFNNVQAVKSSGSYVTVGEKKYWSGGKYHFAAYAPYMEASPVSFEGAGNSFVLKFTDYVTSVSTVDLLYSGFSTDKVKADGIVPLQFAHALARIHFSFTVNDGSKMEGVADNKITLIEIKPISISLGNVLTKGSFTFNGSNASWTGVSVNGNITNTGVSESSTGYDAYILPQTLTNDATFSFTYNIVFHSSDTEVSAGPFTADGLKFLQGTTGTWSTLEMGKQYNVNVRVNAFNGVVDVAPLEVSGWETSSGTVETK